MFCPQCGYRQVSNEVRFCSGCGFPLNQVSELLTHGGQLSWRPPQQQGTRALTARQKGVRQGVMMMLSTLIIVPVVIFLGVAMLDMPAELIPLTAVLCFIGGLLRILYALFLEEGAPPAGSFEQGYVPPPVAPNYLGAHEPTPFAATRSQTAEPQHHQPQQQQQRRPRYDTGELNAPPRSSVTDHTTRLLEDEAGEARRRQR